MAESKPLSTKDLFLLMAGWNRLKKPDDKAKKAEDYWLDNGALRESEWNYEWPQSPKAAWESVRYRDWLIANIAANLTGRNQDFVAISDPRSFRLTCCLARSSPACRTPRKPSNR